MGRDISFGSCAIKFDDEELDVLKKGFLQIHMSMLFESIGERDPGELWGIRYFIEHICRSVLVHSIPTSLHAGDTRSSDFYRRYAGRENLEFPVITAIQLRSLLLWLIDENASGFTDVITNMTSFNDLRRAKAEIKPIINSPINNNSSSVKAFVELVDLLSDAYDLVIEQLKKIASGGLFFFHFFAAW